MRCSSSSNIENVLHNLHNCINRGTYFKWIYLTLISRSVMPFSFVSRITTQLSTKPCTNSISATFTSKLQIADRYTSRGVLPRERTKMIYNRSLDDKHIYNLRVNFPNVQHNDWPKLFVPAEMIKHSITLFRKIKFFIQTK